MLLYPRLRRISALEKFEIIRELPINALGARDCELSDDATFAQTGGRRVTSRDLRRLRDFVEEIANRNGFPGAVTDKERAVFDAYCAVWLKRESGIPLGEAFRGGVWSYLTLEVLPDIAAWRFPGRAPGRFVGGARNTFQRLWLRAFLLDDSTDRTLLLTYMKELKEDSFVQIVERPGSSANPEVATRIAAAWVRAAKHFGPGPMEEIHRKVMKEITQQGAVISFDSMRRADLDGYLDSVFLEFGDVAARG
jgi:hypothetical protein